MDSFNDSRYIISVDVGTTTIRACLYNGKGQLIDSSAQSVEVDVTEEGVLRVEIRPDVLWRQFNHVVQDMVSKVPENSSLIMSICTQRNSFICWDKLTLRPCVNFIAWNDCRARDECIQWNNSLSLKALNMGGSLLYFLTRKPRYRAAKMLKFLCSMVSLRLKVAINEDKEMKDLLRNNQLAFGCLDTWLILKLSKGKRLVTEPSNTSATGMFDPFMNDYNGFILKMLKFPRKLLVPIIDSSRHHTVITTIDKEFFGRPIDVCAVLADQQSALYGCGGHNKGDTMISMGTGTFVLKNVGSTPHASMKGLYPLVGWRMNDKTTFIAEGQQHDTSLMLKWAKSMGWFNNVEETSDIALSVQSSNGLSIVPALGGLQTPYNDDHAACVIFNIKPGTTNEHMVRALLESISFRVYEIYQTMENEIKSNNTSNTRICGGISNNDFVCQTISTLINRPIERISNCSFAASHGVALMAGLSNGYWNQSDIQSMIHISNIFYPISNDRPSLLLSFSQWQKAVVRSLNFE